MTILQDIQEFLTRKLKKDSNLAYVYMTYMVFDLYHLATNEKNKFVLSSKQFEKLFDNLQFIIPIEEFLKSDADTVALQIFIAVNKPEKYQNRFDFKVSVRPELVHNLKCILNEEPPTKFTDIICNDLMKNFHITKQ